MVLGERAQKGIRWRRASRGSEPWCPGPGEVSNDGKQRGASDRGGVNARSRIIPDRSTPLTKVIDGKRVFLEDNLSGR